MKHGSSNPFYGYKSKVYTLMIYGHSLEEIKEMSPEDVEMFIEFESLWRENNNIALSNTIGKCLAGGK